MKVLVGAFNQEKALLGAFSVIVQLHRLIVCSTSLIVDCVSVQLSRLAAPDLPRLHAQGDHLEVDLRQCGQKTDDSLY